MKNILLIDGDILAYTIASNSEQAINWGNDFWTLHTDFNECKDKIKSYLKNVTDNFNAKKVYVFLSDSDNFRKQIYPAYKLNRTNKRKPTCLPQIKRYLFEEHEAISEPRLEADDILGILATSKIIKGNKVICSSTSNHSDHVFDNDVCCNVSQQFFVLIFTSAIKAFMGLGKPAEPIELSATNILKFAFLLASIFLGTISICLVGCSSSKNVSTNFI